LSTLDLAGVKISASASQVTPLAELIEMVQYYQMIAWIAIAKK